MQTVKDFAGRDLVWEKPRALRREFELRSGEEVLATLRWSKGWWSTLAEAASAEGEWTFKRSGFWKPRVTARRPGSETDLATFELGWTGAGVLTLTGGATYRWDNEGLWGSTFVWKDPVGGNPLVRFHHQVMKNKGEVEVSPTASTLADLPFLIVFGWYLAVSLMEERGAAAGAGGGGGAAGG